MNEKLLKVIKAEGYCCMWAFLEANKATYTSKIIALARERGVSLTSRAVRYQRHAYREKLIKCEEKTSCLKQKIKDGHKTP